MKNTSLKQRKFFVNKLFVTKIMSVLIFIYLLTGCMFIPKEEEVLAPPLIDPPKVSYNLLELKKGTIENKVQCTGSFVSVSQKNLSFKDNSGRLKTIHVKVGDRVKKGDLLAELQTDNLDLQIKQQELTLKKLQLTYELTKSNGKKNIELSLLNLESLRKKLKSMNSIEDAYSKEQIESINEQITKAEISYASDKSTYETNIKTAENDIEACRLQLDSLKQKYNSSIIVSPIDGNIDYRTDSKEGDMIEPYKTIVRVADPNELQIQCSADEIVSFDVGMKVELKSGSSEFQGIVAMTPSTAPGDADEKSKSSMIIKPDKLPNDAKIGDRVSIKLVLDRKENVISIPINRIHTLGSRKYVYVMENGLKKERDIETGIETKTDIEVLKGLSEGDKLINN